MTDDPKMLRADADEAARAVKALAKEGEEAAGALQEAFEEAGDAIADALEDAARSGEFSFKAMVEAVLQELAALAIDRLFDGPVADWTRGAGQGLDAMLGGVSGSTDPGGAGLAGLRPGDGAHGPNVFTASNGGSMHALAAPVVNVTINASGDTADGVRRSERQIAAAIARAASRGSQLI